MCTQRKFDLKRLRNPYESDAEWDMREEFLQAHRDSYPVHRLLCLSNCYINSRVYGCRYPEPTMKSLKALSDGLTKSIVDKDMGMQKVKFVKQKEVSKAINFVKATDDYSAVKKEPDLIAGQKTAITSTTNGEETNKKEVMVTETKEVKPGPPVIDEKETRLSNVAGSTKPSTQVKPGPPVKDEKVTSTVAGSIKPAPVTSSLKSSLASECEPKAVVPPPPNLKPSSTQETEPPRYNPRLAQKWYGNFMMPIDQKFFALAESLQELMKKEPNYRHMDVLPIAAMKCKMTFSYKYRELPAPKGLHLFVCSMLHDNILVVEGDGGSKKKARQNSVDAAGKKLCQRYLKVVRTNPETQVLQASDEHFPTSWSLFEQTEAKRPKPADIPLHVESNANNLGSNKRKFSNSCGNLSKFIIIHPANTLLTSGDTAKHILQQSADFNKAMLDYQFHQEGTGVRCRVALAGNILVECFSNGQVAAKTLAAERALEILQKTCWRIKIKQAVDTEEEALSRDQVLNELQEQVNAIPDDNKGRQLLMKMGWTGGGVGAEGNKGLEVPVAVLMASQNVVGRKGLGATGCSEKEFKGKVIEALKSYVCSEKQEDLVFSSEFSKEERAFIHQQAERLGVKSTSRGTGNNRYLTISRRRSAFQLFDHLVAEGGSTAKYELIAPPESQC